MNFIYSNDISLPDFYAKTSGKLTFTSLLSDGRHFLFLKEHLARFAQGVAHFENYSEKERELCEEACKDFLFKNFRPHHYFRLMYAAGTFYFTYLEHHPKPIGVRLLYSKRDRKLSSASFIKDGNYKISLEEIVKAQELGFDDVLFGNEEKVFEASTSNILLVKDQKIIFSSLSENVFDGILIKKITTALKQDFIVSEESLLLEQIKEADEIWITNCIQGMRFVEQITIENWQRAYQIKASLFENIQEKIGRFGELINE